jgi:hypothetical protein
LLPQVFLDKNQPIYLEPFADMAVPNM